MIEPLRPLPWTSQISCASCSRPIHRPEARARAMPCWRDISSRRRDRFKRMRWGNRIAFANANGRGGILLCGHIDEPGFIVSHIGKNGLVYFHNLGSEVMDHISGRAVVIKTARGDVAGVLARKSMPQEGGREKAPGPRVAMWIDIGASTRAEAMERVTIGDPGTMRGESLIWRGRFSPARVRAPRSAPM